MDTADYRGKHIKTSELRDEFIAIMSILEGDDEGRHAAQEYLEHSTAIYHGQVIGMAFVPQFFDQVALAYFNDIIRVTNGILDKVIAAYRRDASYRALFHFSPELEYLALLPTGYSCNIPIGRYDIFLDEDTLDFMFCELNTDGTSAMNEELEMTRALSLSESFEVMQATHSLAAQDLYEGWVDEFLRIYDTYERAVATPHLAIVDFEASGTPDEFAEFARRFCAHGVETLVCPMEHLVWHAETSEAPAGLYSDEGWRIDAVYRRAVTAEVIDAIQAGRAAARQAGRADFDSTLRLPPTAATVLETVSDETRARFPLSIHDEEGLTGVFALVKAAEEQAICLVGSFITNIPHCKQVFQVLHDPATKLLLDADENEFVAAHVPVTRYLTASEIDLEAVKANRADWIIKPSDRSSSWGVYAGRDQSDAEWALLVDEHTDDDYVVQNYCRQYAAPNLRPWPPEDLSRWNLLTGLFSYGEHFGGVYMRAGKNGLIVGYAGGVTVGSFFADCDISALPDHRIVLRDLSC
jgi:hypothetical protein